ncbi:MAG TPA: site-2 protease family protein [Candidatus Kryptonia bacterium]
MRWSFPVGRLLGIPIRVHYTFLILFAFIWYVEGTILGRDAALHSVVFGILIFICVLFHELGHSFIAKKYNLTVTSIILLPIGGVSQISDIPRDPAKEIGITAAGPIVNFLIAGILLLFGELLDPSIRFSESSLQSGNIIVDLFWANIMLGLFNIIPAYPMDGGRILRGIVAIKKDYLEATRLAAEVGKLFAIGFIVAGFLLHFNLWLILIGIFIFSGASSEAEAAVVSSTLEKVTVGDLMITDFKIVLPDEPLTAVVDKSMHTFQNDFPVVDNGRFVGVLTRTAVIEALHRHMHDAKVGEVARIDFPRIKPEDTASMALTKMRSARISVAPVERDGKLLGIITVEKLLEASDIFNDKKK